MKFHTSEREMIQDDLVDFIRDLGYNAPYGILTNLKTLPRGGKVREITFGMARTLDATITIWAPNRIDVSAGGALSRYFQPFYLSAHELKIDLAKAVGKEFPYKKRG